MSTVDINLLKEYFDKEWIDLLKNTVDEYLQNNNDIINRKYFNELGSYSNRNDDTLSKEISDYFKRLLYSPNIAILDYILKNYNLFSGLKFIDNGAGLGLLSIFLNKINIECYNYDNFTQIKNVTFHDDVLKKMNIKINPVTDNIPIDSQVLTCSGIWVDNLKFKEINLKYLLIDRSWIDQGIIKEIKPNYNLLDMYNTIEVYGK